MRINSQVGTGINKKPYVKPEVKQVLLRAEEAVLGSCKTTTAVGPAQAKCKVAGKCSVIGS
jgi:hypothetical protein